MDQIRLGVLDGDTRFGAILVGYLGQQGIAADLHADAGPLLARLGESPPSLVVVHEYGPGMALPMLHVIRAFSRVPCIVVADEDDPERSVGLLDAGADDMMPRETPMPIMLARMRAVLRRGAWGLTPEGDARSRRAEVATPPGRHWRLIRRRRELHGPDGAECPLTTAEFDLFCLLVDSGPTAVSREAIARDVFRRSWRPEDRTVDNLVVRLRRKLKDDTYTTVRTLHGQGYAFLGFEGAELREV